MTRVVDWLNKCCGEKIISWWRENYLHLFLLGGLVFLVYFNSLDNQFVSDDIYQIQDNPQLGQFPYVFKHPFKLLRPFFYYLIVNLCGRQPVAFHLLNIFFHGGTTLLSFVVISKLMNRWVAAVAAGFFAVHPLLTEAVTWISGGIYPQYAFFFWLSFLAYLNKNKKWVYGLAVASFLLCLFSSYKSFVLGLAFPLYEFCRGGWKGLKDNWRRYLPLLVLAAVWGGQAGLQIGSRRDVLVEKFGYRGGIGNPLVSIPIALVNYLGLLVWPAKLTLYHAAVTLSPATLTLGTVTVLVYLISLGLSYFGDRMIFFWLVFFLLPLAPFLTPFGISWLVAERYIYVGSIAFFVLAAKLLDLLKRRGGLEGPIYMFLVAVMSVLMVRTLVRNQDWQNRDILWRVTAEASPRSPKAHNNLGDLYLRHGDKERAIGEFKKAIALSPSYADAYHNLANTYREMGQFDLAITNYNKALQRNPSLWQSHLHLGVVYFGQSEYEKARQHLTEVVETVPSQSGGWLYLGLVCQQQADDGCARQSFEKALQLGIENPAIQRQVKEALNRLP